MTLALLSLKEWLARIVTLAQNPCAVLRLRVKSHLSYDSKPNLIRNWNYLSQGTTTVRNISTFFILFLCPVLRNVFLARRIENATVGKTEDNVRVSDSDVVQIRRWQISAI